jgi:Uma2 family endonuclease
MFAAKIPMSMTVEEFLEWDSGDDYTWQLVDGEPQAMAPTKRTHGALQSELGRQIGNHLERVGGPCSVVTAPGIIPKVLAKHNFRIPDLAVSCTPYESEESALSNPVLIVEILSPSNQAATRSNVWTYATIPSIQEILVLKSIAIGAELLRRLPDGSWPAEPLIVSEGELALDSIGFRVDLAQLYRTTRLARPA